MSVLIITFQTNLTYHRLSEILNNDNYDEIYAHADRYNALNLLAYCNWFRNQ